jgi:uncharacterized protein YraI
MIFFSLFLLFFLPISVQQDSTDVYVTTQDYTSLRAGAGFDFERLEVIPPGVTLQAIERSEGSRWIKVVYEGQTGWIAYWLLIWTGDLFALPEFKEPLPESSSGVYVTTTDFSSLRAGPGTAWERVAVVPPNITLAAIGRTVDARWLQVDYEGQTGWIVYWLLSERGRVFSLPIDGVNPRAFIRMDGPGRGRVVLAGNVSWSSAWIVGHRYSWLLAPLYNDLVNGVYRLAQIERIWRTMASGGRANCEIRVERPIFRPIAEASLQIDMAFRPMRIALDSAIQETNQVITRFEDACGRADLFVTERDIETALAEIQDANRYYILVFSLLRSFEAR